MLRFLAVPGLSAAAVAAAPALEAPDALVMKLRAIGPLKSATKLADLLALGLPVERTDTNVEGDPVSVYTVRVDARNLVSMWFQPDDAAYMIETKSSGFHTLEGAHVGGTVGGTMAELRRLYPNGRMLLSMEEGAQLAFILESRGQAISSFQIDTDGVTHDCVHAHKGCPDLESRASTSFLTSWY